MIRQLALARTSAAAPTPEMERRWIETVGPWQPTSLRRDARRIRVYPCAPSLIKWLHHFAKNRIAEKINAPPAIKNPAALTMQPCPPPQKNERRGLLII
jgi:hypothetical protein